jgi:heme A synthase
MNDTYIYIQKFHAYWAYAAITLLLIAIIASFIGWSSKKEFTPGSRRAALLGLIGVHVQFLIGIILYFVSPLGKEALSQIKIASYRLTALEHPLINLIAIVLITTGWSLHKKKATSPEKFKTIAIFYSIGAVLILSRIPWDLWFK